MLTVRLGGRSPLTARLTVKYPCFFTPSLIFKYDNPRLKIISLFSKLGLRISVECSAQKKVCMSRDVTALHHVKIVTLIFYAKHV